MTLAGRTIASLAADLNAGRATSRALTEDALAAIAKEGSAFTLVTAERARVAAEASDRLRASGVVPSPLAGVPISIKDLFDVAGEVTAAGSVVLKDAPAAVGDAPPVARLRAAGAIIVGRTHMSEFAFSGLGANPHYPRCTNPRDPERVPGGSSSGAAVSVARGQAAVGLGTDTGGSTRIPPAFCGIVGFKPTQARVTRAGAFPLSETLDSIGPVANSVACCALVDGLIADLPLAPHPRIGVAGLRLAVVSDLVLDGIDETVSRAFDRALRRLRDAGAHVEQLRVPGLLRITAVNARGTIANAEAYAFHTRTGTFKMRDRYDPNVAARIDVGSRMSAADYLTIVHERAVLTAEAAAASAPYDALVFPTTPIVAPRFDEISDQAGFGRANALALRNPSVVNFLDRCALSVPMHLADELPSGLMLVGEHMGDARLFAVGMAVEAVLAG